MITRRNFTQLLKSSAKVCAFNCVVFSTSYAVWWNAFTSSISGSNLGLLENGVIAALAVFILRTHGLCIEPVSHVLSLLVYILIVD